MVLHIANGSILKAYLATKCAADQKVIAFNESMITGACSEDIFSEEFFRMRAENLQVTYEQYAELTIVELDELLNHLHFEINLWFDADMFCQINVLTLCAYLATSNYQGNVQLHIIRHDFWRWVDLQDIVIKTYLINLEGYYEMYQKVLVKRQTAGEDYPAFAELNEGIRLYENYTSPKSEIRLAIEKMIKENRSEQFIINEICKQYPHYGIGDYNIKLLYLLLLEEL